LKAPVGWLLFDIIVNLDLLSDRISRRNPDHFPKSPVPVLAPKAALALIAAEKSGPRP
jgi:hypothetical protein